MPVRLVKENTKIDFLSRSRRTIAITFSLILIVVSIASVATRGLAFGIDFTGGNGGVTATLAGPRRPLTDARLLAACLRRPFGSRRVLALIHWQALKLWWKGARFRRRPEPPDAEVSR